LTLTKERESFLTVKDLGFGSPSFSEDELGEIAKSYFGISGDLKDLGGERDQNTRITCPNGRSFLLKISGVTEDPGSVDFQVRALLHIEQVDPGLPVPRLVPGLDGGLVQQHQHKGESSLVRLLTFLPGIPYSSGTFPSTSGLQSIGGFLARLDRALADFTHPASQSFMPWDIGSNLTFTQQFRDLVPDGARALCDPLLDRLEHRAYPQLKQLRQQVIHQDAHGGNLLRADSESEEVIGVIDFGDMIQGPLISDIAITASHFMEKGIEIEDTAISVCLGFHSVTPLTAHETDLLLDLVTVRQLLTLQLFEFRRLNMPHSPPQDVDEKPRIISSLERLSKINSEDFRDRLRSECGLNTARSHH